MKAYVINLDRQPERLARFYNPLGSEIFERIPAVDRKVLELIGNKDFFFDVHTFSKIIPRGVTMGEIACTLSHIRCWQKIVSDPLIKDDEFTLIAEDDVTLLPNKQRGASFTKVIEDIANALHGSNIQLVKLQMIPYYNKDLFTGSGNISLQKEIPVNYHTSYNNTGSSLYLIRKRLAQDIVNKLQTTKPYWLADGFSFFCNPNQIMMSLPLLGYVEGDMPSDLESKRESQRLAYIQAQH